MLPSHGADWECVLAILDLGVFPLDGGLDLGFEVGHLAPFKVEVSAVFLGDIVWVYVLREGGEYVGGREDENFGHGDGVKPALDPAPDGGEEDRCANDLRCVSCMHG